MSTSGAVRSRSAVQRTLQAILVYHPWCSDQRPIASYRRSFVYHDQECFILDEHPGPASVQDTCWTVTYLLDHVLWALIQVPGDLTLGTDIFCPCSHVPLQSPSVLGAEDRQSLNRPSRFIAHEGIRIHLIWKQKAALNGFAISFSVYGPAYGSEHKSRSLGMWA